MYTFTSVTPGKFSSLPTWVLSPKFKDEFVMVRDTYGQSKYISVDKLRHLMSEHKLRVYTSDEGNKFIPSISYIKYF